MNFYFISPIGKKSDFLYDTFIPEFNRQGHQIVENIEDSDFAFYDLWCGFGEYDNWPLQVIMDKRVPIAVLDFFDYNNKVLWHGFNNFQAVKHESWAKYLRMFLDAGLVKAYFMRKMHKYLEYPDYVHPIECILYPDHDFQLTAADELFNRPNDIFFIGNTSKEREYVCNELSKHFKCDFVLGQERIPHNQWVDRARQAKMFLTADGGGFSDERGYQLITISAMLRQSNNQKLAFPFKDGVSCWEVNEQPNRFDIEDLRLNLTHKETLYRVYTEGVRHMKQHYTADARAAYILDVINKSIK